MKILARLLWGLAVLLGVAAFPIFILACWAHGDSAGRFAGTGFVTVIAAVVAGGAGFAANEQAR